MRWGWARERILKILSGCHSLYQLQENCLSPQTQYTLFSACVRFRSKAGLILNCWSICSCVHRSKAGLILNCWSSCSCVAEAQDLGLSYVQPAGGVVMYHDGGAAVPTEFVSLDKESLHCWPVSLCVHFRHRRKYSLGFNQVKCERNTALLFCCEYIFPEYQLCPILRIGDD